MPNADVSLLEKYIHTFYGYGCYGGDFWFVGKEESGGGADDVRRRLSAWSQRGCRELEDVCEYHEAFGVTDLFGQHPKMQSTWKKLIRSVLKAKGKEATTEQVRKYQGQQLGREHRETCLLELLPLPAPSTGKWLYADYSQLPQLRDRQVYGEHYAPQRAKHIREQVLEYKPRAVIFYSSDSWYQRWWKEIAGGVSFGTHENGFQSGTDDSTLFIIAKHPTAHGMTNQYFEKIGDLIASQGC